MIRQIFLTIVMLGAVAQVIVGQHLVAESKADISLSYLSVTPRGNKEAGKGNFIFPSLFSNFTKGNGIGVQFEKQVNKSLFLGLRGTAITFSDWQFTNESEVFKDASALIRALNFSIGLKSRFREKGTMNKLKLSVSAAPGIYLLVVNTPNGINQQVSSGGNQASIYVDSKSSGFGILASAGAEYTITNTWGLRVQGAYEYMPGSSSVVYMDKSVQWTQITIGLVLRLARNKDYIRTKYE
ncbi:MAG TPA: hypothetical protein VK666_06460 [Chryseolinea sp.]|nr:hypothetical protein [Chryseolinea sp.]